MENLLLEMTQSPCRYTINNYYNHKGSSKEIYRINLMLTASFL
jgi:hypothetical protein